jgi:hypothetical protein
VLLADALDQAGLSWTVAGNAGWFGQGGVTQDGVDAAQSGAIGHGQQSVLETTVSGGTSIGFWWQVSSEVADQLTFSIDGVPQFSKGGTTSWAWEGFTIPSGVHTLRWTYAKNGSGSAGADAAWVDGLSVGLFGAAQEVGGGWRWSDWFGYVNTATAPWLHHDQHGWLYAFGQDPGGVVFWDAGMNTFWWTSESLYTFLYRFSDNAWLWYLPDSDNPRWMLNLTTGQWEQR